MAKTKVSLTKKVLFALVLGITYGIISNLCFSSGFNTGVSKWVLAPVGSIFYNLIQMIVVPLVLFSLICGTASITNIKKLGRVGGKIIVFYLTTTAFAVILGLIFANLIHPGAGVPIPTASTFKPTTPPFIMDIFVNMVPKNPFASLTNGEMLPIIVFAIFVGIVMSLLGDPVKPLLNLCKQANELFLRMVGIIMQVAPFGVFALIAKVISLQGMSVLLQLMKFVMVVYLVLIIHCAFTYCGALKVLGHVSPLTFFKKFWPVMAFAFSTSSSNATIPLNLETCEKKLGVPKSISSFTIPLGATVNMDGTAIMQGVAAVFIAEVFGIPLSVPAQLMVILSATLASIGTAGVPGAGTVMLAMVLQQVGLPMEGIVLVLAVDRILDMGRTAINITGDAVGTVIVANSEKDLDLSVYNNTEVKSNTIAL